MLGCGVEDLHLLSAPPLPHHRQVVTLVSQVATLCCVSEPSLPASLDLLCLEAAPLDVSVTGHRAAKTLAMLNNVIS